MVQRTGCPQTITAFWAICSRLTSSKLELHVAWLSRAHVLKSPEITTMMSDGNFENLTRPARSGRTGRHAVRSEPATMLYTHSAASAACDLVASGLERVCCLRTSPRQTLTISANMRRRWAHLIATLRLDRTLWITLRRCSILPSSSFGALPGSSHPLISNAVKKSVVAYSASPSHWTELRCVSHG